MHARPQRLPPSKGLCLSTAHLSPPQVRIQVWAAGQAGSGTPLVDCTSAGRTGAVEVGGGPWWSPWKAEAAMAEPIKQLLNLPIDMEALADVLPPQLRPPGL